MIVELTKKVDKAEQERNQALANISELRSKVLPVEGLEEQTEKLRMERDQACRERREMREQLEELQEKIRDEPDNEKLHARIKALLTTRERMRQEKEDLKVETRDLQQRLAFYAQIIRYNLGIILPETGQPMPRVKESPVVIPEIVKISEIKDVSPEISPRNEQMEQVESESDQEETDQEETDQEETGEVGQAEPGDQTKKDVVKLDEFLPWEDDEVRYYSKNSYVDQYWKLIGVKTKLMDPEKYRKAFEQREQSVAEYMKRFPPNIDECVESWLSRMENAVQKNSTEIYESEIDYRRYISEAIPLERYRTEICKLGMRLKEMVAPQLGAKKSSTKLRQYALKVFATEELALLSLDIETALVAWKNIQLHNIPKYRMFGLTRAVFFTTEFPKTFTDSSDLAFFTDEKLLLLKLPDLLNMHLFSPYGDILHKVMFLETIREIDPLAHKDMPCVDELYQLVDRPMNWPKWRLKGRKKYNSHYIPVWHSDYDFIELTGDIANGLFDRCLTIQKKFHRYCSTVFGDTILENITKNTLLVSDTLALNDLINRMVHRFNTRSSLEYYHQFSQDQRMPPVQFHAGKADREINRDSFMKKMLGFYPKSRISLCKKPLNKNKEWDEIYTNLAFSEDRIENLVKFLGPYPHYFYTHPDDDLLNRPPYIPS